MRRFLFLIISSCVMLYASAQEEISLDSIPNHPAELGARQPVMEKPLLFDDSLFFGGNQSD